MAVPPETSLSFALPADHLKAYITTYYLVATRPGERGSIEDYLHPEWANLRIGLKGNWAKPMPFSSPRTLLFGPTSKTVPFEPVGDTLLLGVGLLPLGWAHFTNMPAIEASDKILPPEGALARVEECVFSVNNPACAADFKPTLDAFFTQLPSQCDEKEKNLILRAHMALMQPQVNTVEDMADLLKIGPRQMSRISQRAFGFTPKLLLRRQRFLRTLQRMRADLDRPWSHQLDDSYVDQSHFIRDFKFFMGMAPRTYFSLPREILDPAARLRSQIAGQSVQGLHTPRPEAQNR